ncbi:hypothetical protein [Candidatus Chromulinivorax destructor]|uniref:Uncharacterized protein n=1 Tax=Candidatus Chromulinivorax destructor TaxID=2066483 RepID=A0A345ZBU3_9BACT|nr:hypothetical protein [Candidatus Chromulinivorax destructor]AXK60760.1 hypothetical protein C0J27_03355 [Candidatus Chromulinivorax destructor]
MKNRKSTPDIMSNLMLNQSSLIATEPANMQNVNIDSNKTVLREQQEMISLKEDLKEIEPASNKTVKKLSSLQ